MTRTLAMALSCAGMAAAVAPVPAEAQSVRILTSLTTQELAQAMNRIGGSASLIESPQGSVAMQLVFANGLNAQAQLSCNETVGCSGLNLIAFFTPAQQMSIAQALDRTNRYDWARAAVASGVDEQGRMYVSRYLILDGGITETNLLTNLQVFAALCEEFANL